tara:strand:+ start:10124 stop:11176 length:1053 start_codon:yes stop_codon:yes gene_type:complete
MAFTMLLTNEFKKRWMKYQDRMGFSVDVLEARLNDIKLNINNFEELLKNLNTQTQASTLLSFVAEVNFLFDILSVPQEYRIDYEKKIIGSSIPPDITIKTPENKEVFIQIKSPRNGEIEGRISSFESDLKKELSKVQRDLCYSLEYITVPYKYRLNSIVECVNENIKINNYKFVFDDSKFKIRFNFSKPSCSTITCLTHYSSVFGYLDIRKGDVINCLDKASKDLINKTEINSLFILLDLSFCSIPADILLDGIYGDATTQVTTWGNGKTTDRDVREDDGFISLSDPKDQIQGVILRIPQNNMNIFGDCNYVLCETSISQKQRSSFPLGFDSILNKDTFVYGTIAKLVQS